MQRVRALLSDRCERGAEHCHRVRKLAALRISPVPFIQMPALTISKLLGGVDDKTPAAHCERADRERCVSNRAAVEPALAGGGTGPGGVPSGMMTTEARRCWALSPTLARDMLVRMNESIITPALTTEGGTNKRVSVRYGIGLARMAPIAQRPLSGPGRPMATISSPPPEDPWLLCVGYGHGSGVKSRTDVTSLASRRTSSAVELKSSSYPQMPLQAWPSPA